VGAVDSRKNRRQGGAAPPSGAAFSGGLRSPRHVCDTPYDGGSIPDQRRTDFFRAYIGAVARAIKDGANICKYHAWSLLDNFECAEGYSQRFGLTYVHFRNQERTIKDSGIWYGHLAATGKLS
jgi:beta-glucosidase